jgi:hypothetical protein
MFSLARGSSRVGSPARRSSSNGTRPTTYCHGRGGRGQVPRAIPFTPGPAYRSCVSETGDDLHPELSRRSLPTDVQVARVQADVEFRVDEERSRIQSSRTSMLTSASSSASLTCIAISAITPTFQSAQSAQTRAGLRSGNWQESVWPKPAFLFTRSRVDTRSNPPRTSEEEHADVGPRPGYMGHGGWRMALRPLLRCRSSPSGDNHAINLPVASYVRLWATSESAQAWQRAKRHRPSAGDRANGCYRRSRSHSRPAGTSRDSQGDGGAVECGTAGPSTWRERTDRRPLRRGYTDVDSRLSARSSVVLRRLARVPDDLPKVAVGIAEVTRVDAPRPLMRLRDRGACGGGFP